MPKPLNPRPSGTQKPKPSSIPSTEEYIRSTTWGGGTK